MIDEGYTKFEVDWQRGEPPRGPTVETLNHWRNKLYAARLIGHDDALNVGYGNISIRDGNGFIISGTQTGQITRTGPAHYARVIAADIAANRVSCVGPIQASSESMTHAAIYQAAPWVTAVVHAHDTGLWASLLDRLPTTAATIPYGTPDMANEFARLLDDPAFTDLGRAVMGGHEGGLITIGRSIQQAARRMLDFAAGTAGR